MVIQPGEKVHVIMRRMYESQVRRHFVGVIKAVDGANVRASGYVFIYDDRTAQYVRKQTPRTTVLNLAESGYIVNVIPPAVDLDEVRYETIDRTELFFTDGKDFRLNVNEFGVRR